MLGYRSLHKKNLGFSLSFFGLTTSMVGVGFLVAGFALDAEDPRVGTYIASSLCLNSAGMGLAVLSRFGLVERKPEAVVELYNQALKND